MSITYKEYVWLTNPSNIKDIFHGGVCGCPKDYEISNDIVHTCNRHDFTKCYDCWNQVIPYPVIAEAIEGTEIDPFVQVSPGSKFEVREVDMNTCGELGVRILICGQKFWVKHKCFTYYIDKEKKKVKKKFTKSDLRDGMVVEMRNGERGIVIGKRIVMPHGWYGLDSVCVSSDEYSIVKVFGVGDHITGLDSVLTDAEVGELIWERKEKEISSEEAYAVLKEHYGCDVKIKE